MAGVRSYWRWLGQRLRLSHPGRVFFTAALLVGGAGIAFGQAHGDREGGAPLVVVALVLAAVVALDAVGRGVVPVVRCLIFGLGFRRRSRALAQAGAISRGRRRVVAVQRRSWVMAQVGE